MLALLYGAQPKKLASVFKCSVQETQTIIDSIMRKLPGVTAWKNRVVYEARQKGYVSTLFGRQIPIPGIKSDSYYERLHWERCAVNYQVQGSAAEIMKLGLIKLKENGLCPVITVHDEYLIEVGKSQDVSMIPPILENIVKLEVPLKVEVGTGKNWQEAKR
jgi:DNA polymerase-1